MKAMDLVEKLRGQMRNRPELQMAILFGSTARGTDRPGSDVDLGILLDPYSPALRFEVEAQLGRAARRPVHVILLDEAPPLLRFEMTRDGVLLFEREAGLWSRFKAKAMIDWYDWAPIARRINAAMIRRLKDRVALDEADGGNDRAPALDR
jgi:hypothetical protein